jgi:hypothetical protein
VATWLALLLFVEDELFNGEPALQVSTVENWQHNRLLTGTINATQFYEYDKHEQSTILWPDIKPEWYESDEDLANTQSNIIDISPEAFRRLVPGKDDLRYLAHARQIDPSAKDTSYLKIKGDGWYSVMMSKRLPDLPQSDSELPGRLNIMHLVSLEGFEDYINGSALPADKTSIRMISLASWSFTCLKESGDTFAELINGLLSSDGQEKSTTFNLATPTQEGVTLDQYTLQYLQQGYVPMQYQTQQGEKTFAWYRGPFSAVPVTNFIGDPRIDPTQCVQFNTASQAAIYNPDYGLFDLSYSVAWETGRFMALADQYFGPQLIAWQQAGHKLTDLLLQRQFQLTTLNNSAPDSATLLASAKPKALTKGFIKKLTQQFMSQLAPRLFNPNTAANRHLPRRKPFRQLRGPVANTENLNALLQDPALNDYVLSAADDGADYLTQWLSSLYLLEDVPFTNLLPNEALLPPESVKFFYVDSNWLDCLIEGALSIGIQSSRDVYYQNLTKNVLYGGTYKDARQARSRLLQKYTYKKPVLTSEAVDKTSMGGMFLRSTIVTSWPGLEVKAYAQTLADSDEPDTTTLIPLLRMDRLSDDVLLCLWNAVPKVITINQPQEGIQFGFADAPVADGLTAELDPDSYYLYLRSLAAENYGIPLSGEQYEINAVTENLIDEDRQVILQGDNGLIALLETTLAQADLAVRDFVTEIIKVPEQGLFAVPDVEQESV